MSWLVENIFKGTWTVVQVIEYKNEMNNKFYFFSVQTNH